MNRLDPIDLENLSRLLRTPMAAFSHRAHRRSRHRPAR